MDLPDLLPGSGVVAAGSDRKSHHQAAAYGWRQGTPFTVLNLSVYRQVVDLVDPATASFVVPRRQLRRPGEPAHRRPARGVGAARAHRHVPPSPD